MVPVSNIRSNFLKIHPSSSYRQWFAGFCWNISICDFLYLPFFWCLNRQRCEIRHHLGAIIGCHLFAFNERIFRLLGSIWWRSSLPQWMGQPGSGEGGFFDFKDRAGQITLEKKVYPKTSWRLEDDPFWEGIGQASNYVTEGNGINIPWNTESYDTERLEVELDQDLLNLLGPLFWMTIANQKRQTQLWCRGILELLHKEMVYSIKDFTALACEKFLGLIELDVNTRT